MATKKTTTKSTKKAAKKPAAKKTAAKKSAVKKAVPAAVTIPPETASVSAENPAIVQFAYATLAVAITYGFGSWALDTGSLWLYAATFVGLYLIISFTKSGVQLLLKKNSEK